MLTEVKYDNHIQGEVIDFTMMECGNCGIPFFVPTRWHKNKVNEHGSFTCPNGCNRIFVAKTDTEKLQEQLDELQKEKARNEQILQDRWLDAVGERQKIEKKLKRVHNGVCPCCNRSFQNLQNHMKTKHPELVKDLPVKKLPKSKRVKP